MSDMQIQPSAEHDDGDKPNGLATYNIPSQLPQWITRGQTQFNNTHAGPAELAKNVLFHSSTADRSFADLMNQNSQFYGQLNPKVVWDFTTKYDDTLLDEMQALGINLIQVTWSCGFSTDSEQIQRDILIGFTRKAHTRNIHICAYHSLTNIFWSDVFQTEPHLEKMVAKYSDGTPSLYAHSQARYLMCINQPEWIEHLKKKIHMALVEADVDAIYFDNLFSNCACDRCQNMFSDFTEQLVGKQYEMPPFVRVPPAAHVNQAIDERESEARTASDSSDNDEEFSRGYLHRLFIAHRLADVLKELRDYAFSIRSSIAFSANNHLMPFINDVCNVLYSQDTLVPSKKWSNIPYLRYLAAESFNWKPVLTNHALKDDDPRLSMAEAMAFQSYPYGITHKEYNLFYKSHPDLFVDVEPMAKIGVVWHWPKRIAYSRYFQSMGMENLLYEIILPDHWSANQLSQYDVILLPDLQGISDDLYEALTCYQRDGGTVIATGKGVLRDEFGRMRLDRSAILSHPHKVEDRISDDIIQQIRQASNPQYLQVCGDPWIVVNLVKKRNQSVYIMHILNYEPTIDRRATITMNIPDHIFKRAIVYCPDTSPDGRSVSLRDDGSISLDSISVYNIVRFE